MSPVGGISPQDASDPGIVSEATWAVQQYAAQASNKEELDTIQSAGTQVVAGVKYIFEVTTKPSGTQLKLETWSKPWQDFHQLTSYTALN